MVDDSRIASTSGTGDRHAELNPGFQAHNPKVIPRERGDLFRMWVHDKKLEWRKMDFGKRSDPPCSDCDTDGHCTMNCGPAVPAGKYLVRQYRPNFYSGFENDVVLAVLYGDITKAPWCENFKHKGFQKFTVTPYHGDELIIEAHYDDGKHWVVGFALPEDSDMMSNNGDKMRDNWRYKPHVQNPQE